MFRQVLQHIVLASSLLNSSKLWGCGNNNKSHLIRPCYFSSNKNNTFQAQDKIKSIELDSSLKHLPLKKYRSIYQAQKKFLKQGICPLRQPIMEGNSSQCLTNFTLPKEIRGMKKLNKSAFVTKMKLPCVIVDHKDLQKIMYLLKSFIVKREKMNSVQDYDEANIIEKNDELEPQVEVTEGPDGNFNRFPSRIYQREGFTFKHNSKSKVIILNPDYVEKFEDFGNENIEALASANLTAKNFAYCEVTLTYNNFSAEEILKAILPSMISSHTSVGHIVQCNLHEEHEDYKFIIGNVLLDKISTCETVVCKTHIINNTYRNFQMELLAGTPNMITVHRENGYQFKMDFSKVYWNSRLSTEHARLANEIIKGDVLLDVFAGVGPFSIPAACKGARVFANDLNPDSVHWLKVSIQLNQRRIQIPITVVNKDAKDFIQTDVRRELLQWIAAKKKEKQPMKIDPDVTKAQNATPMIKIVMNLPATAIGYVKYLCVLTAEEFNDLDAVGPLPTLYLYTFQPKIDLETKATIQAVAGTVQLFAAHGLRFDAGNSTVHLVRNVAPNKNMYKVVMKLTREYLVKREDSEMEQGVKRGGEGSSDLEAKKMKVE